MSALLDDAISLWSVDSQMIHSNNTEKPTPNHLASGIIVIIINKLLPLVSHFWFCFSFTFTAYQIAFVEFFFHIERAFLSYLDLWLLFFLSQGKEDNLAEKVLTAHSDETNEVLEIVGNDLEALSVSEVHTLKLLKSAKSDERPEIIHGEPFTDRKSTFQAHLAHVVSQEQVKQVLEELKENRKINNAAHNVMAYRIYCEDRSSFLQDCDDDGEAMAGSRLLHLLQILGARNIVVIVTRWYGGILLGPDRFKHYNNCARDVMKAAGLVDSNPSDLKESKSKSRFKIGKRQ